MSPEKRRYMVAAAFSVNTPGGIRTFQPGVVLSLVQERAAPYLHTGQLREIAPDPGERPEPDSGGRLLIPWRTATGRLIYLAESPAAAAQAPAGAAAFQLAELHLIWGASPAMIETIISAKEAFPNATIEPGPRRNSP